MNNQFSQRVSDIIVYSKEEANRLRNRYIGPEHLLLGMLRDGEGKAIEILSKLNANLTIIKQQIEAQLKAEADDMLLPDAEVPLSNDAAKVLKMCILEARGMRSNIADTEHVLLAILREKNNMAASVLEANDINYVVNKQDSYIKNFEDNLISGITCGYMGLAHTPLILRAGYKLGWK